MFLGRRGNTTAPPLDDVATGKYYENAGAWAANKLVEGYGYGKSVPKDMITREQMTAILHRFCANTMK